MYISDIERAQKSLAKTALDYLVAAIVLMVFGGVYEHFSHGVYSNYMIYAFAVPLLGGTLPFLVMSRKQLRIYPEVSDSRLYCCGLATLSVGCVVRGVLDIYGTTSTLVSCYWIAGIALSAAGAAAFLLKYRRAVRSDATWRRSC